MLIVNADDLGRTEEDTDNILSCFQRGLVTSASAMVFMADSRRAAILALSAGLEMGLHLNMDQSFSGPDLPPKLAKYHQRVVRYLRRGKWPQVLFNPALSKSFRYAFEAQHEEFCRLFGKEPARIDGHHHMHLCMNMMVDRIIPRGMAVRRNFTFSRGEKNYFNRLYRRLVDAFLVHRYVCTDAFFSIEPVKDLLRQEEIFRLARSRNVEIMVHPGIREQYEHLMSSEYLALIRSVPMGTYAMLNNSPD